MNCRFVETRLDSFVDGELSGEEMLLVRSHLSECKLCAKNHDSVKSFKRIVRVLPQREVSSDLEQRLLRAVRLSEPAASPRRPRVFQLAFGFCACAVSVGIAVATFSTLGAPAVAENDSLDEKGSIATDQEFDHARNPFFSGMQVGYDSSRPSR